MARLIHTYRGAFGSLFAYTQEYIMNKKWITKEELNEMQAKFEQAIRSPAEWEAYDWDDIPRLIAEVRKYLSNK